MVRDPQDNYSQFRKGLLEVAVLSIISAHEVYAADILEQLSDTEFKTAEGTLYPLLSKMKRDELLDYSWAESTTGPPRKYYKLTSGGKLRLQDSQDYITKLTTTIQELGGARHA